MSPGDPRFSVRIPDRDLPWLDAFLRDHPEERERIEDVQRRAREARDFAEVVIAEVYNHYVSGSPSRWGLRVTLRSFLSLLDEEAAEVRRREAGDLADLLREIDEITAATDRNPRRHDPAGYARRLLTVTDDLLNEVDDTRAALVSMERIGHFEARQARANALREAADLVPGEAEREELERRAVDAETAPLTLDELAAELGVELDPPEPKEPNEQAPGADDLPETRGWRPCHPDPALVDPDRPGLRAHRHPQNELQAWVFRQPVAEWWVDFWGNEHLIRTMSDEHVANVLAFIRERASRIRDMVVLDLLSEQVERLQTGVRPDHRALHDTYTAYDYTPAAWLERTPLFQALTRRLERRP